MAHGVAGHIVAILEQRVVVTGTTVTPSTVAAVVSIGSPTVTSTATVTPSTVQAVTTVGTATPATGTTVTPSTVAAVVSIGSPTIVAATTVTPSTVAAHVSIPAPTVTLGVPIQTVAAHVTVGTVTIIASGTTVTTTVAAHVTIPSVVSPSGAFITTVSGRNFIDQFGQPILSLADSGWNVMSRMSTTVMGTYFASRQSLGFNTVGVYLITSTATGGFDTVGTTFDGLVPFTGNDMAAPNATYWARVDTMFQLAAQYGQTIVAFPAEHQGWGSFVQSSGSTKCTNYGTFLGNRYKTYQNIVWMFGDDYPSTAWAAEDPRYLNILSGIQGAGDTHLVGMQQYWDTGNGSSFANPTWDAHVNMSTTYIYNALTSYILTSYNDAQVLPNVMIESAYEGETPQSNTGLRNMIRRQIGWTYLAGAVSYFYGNTHIWQWDASGPTSLNTAAQNDCSRVIAQLRSLGWSNLVPDQGVTFITSGRGTDIDLASASTYCGCARTADGLLSVIYMPTSRTFTLNTALMAGSVTGYWFDPTTASTTTYTGPTHPGNNSAGDGDWFLVLQVLGGLTITPSTVQAVTTVGTPVEKVAAVPSTVQATVTIGAPTVTAAVTVTPATVAAVTTVGAPVITTAVTVTPTTVAAVVSIATPSIIAGGSATVFPVTVAAVVSMAATVETATAIVTATTVAAVVTIGTITVTTGITVTPATVATTVTIANVNIIGEGPTVVSTVAAVVSIPTPFTTGGVIPPSVVVARTYHLDNRATYRFDSRRNYRET